MNIEGIDNNIMEKCQTITTGGVINTNCGLVILIMHQCAHAGKGNSMHSLAQMEWCRLNVDDKSMKVSGKQHITALDGCVIPLDALDATECIAHEVQSPLLQGSVTLHEATQSTALAL